MQYKGKEDISLIDIDNISNGSNNKIDLSNTLDYYIKKDNLNVSLEILKYVIYYKHMHFTEALTIVKKYDNNTACRLNSYITKYYLSD